MHKAGQLPHLTQGNSLEPVLLIFQQDNISQKVISLLIQETILNVLLFHLFEL